MRFTQNLALLDITNSSLDTVIFDLEEILGILDLRSLGDYKIKQGILHQNLSKYYRLELADILCNQYVYKYIKERKKRRDKREISMVRS